MSFGAQIGMMAGGANKAKYTGSDFKHQLQANSANANVKNTYNSAKADGRLSMFEKRVKPTCQLTLLWLMIIQLMKPKILLKPMLKNTNGFH
jgi:hypothetical protein